MKIQLIFAIICVLVCVPFIHAQSSLESVTINNSRISNSFGAPVGNNININQQIVITADVTNNLPESQEFIFIYQVKDESGRVMALAWISGLLSPEQTFSPGRGWTPKQAGVYTIEIFVWDNLKVDGRNALSEFKTMEIIVS